MLRNGNGSNARLATSLLRLLSWLVGPASDAAADPTLNPTAAAAVNLRSGPINRLEGRGEV